MRNHPHISCIGGSRHLNSPLPQAGEGPPQSDRVRVRTRRALLAIISIASLTGCADVARPGDRSVAHQRLILNRIADTCGLPRSAFHQVSFDDVHFRPSPDATYESVDCGLRQLQSAHIPLRSQGFVGNELRSETVQNAQEHHE